MTEAAIRYDCAEQWSGDYGLPARSPGARVARPGSLCRDDTQRWQAMTDDPQARIRELTKGMLRKKLYVVLSKGGAAPEQIAEYLPRHLEYMIGLEKQGVLFASGPLAEADGKMRGDGLILRAANAEAARKIAQADPFVVHGLRSFELREWTVMEGSLGIRLNFSDQSLVVE